MIYGNANFFRRLYLRLSGLAFVLSLTSPFALAQVMSLTSVSTDGLSTMNFSSQIQGITPVSTGVWSVNLVAQGVVYIAQNAANAPAACSVTIGTAAVSKSGGSVANKGSFPFTVSGPGNVSATLVGGRYQATMTGNNGSTNQTRIVYFDGNFTVPFSYKNTHSVPVYIDWQQDGQDMGSMVVQPGQSIATSFPTTSHSPIQPVEQVPVVASDNEGNLINTGQMTSTNLGSPITPSSGSGSSTTLTATTNDNFSIGSLDRGPVVWDQSQGGSTLDGALYRAGVNKIVAAVSSGSSGSGSTTIDLSGVTSRLDTLNTTQTDTKTMLSNWYSADTHAASDKVSDLVTSFDGSGKSAAAVTSATSAATSMQTQANSVVSQFGSASLPDEPLSASTDSVTLTIAPGRTVVVPLNPFSASGPFGGVLNTLASFIRRLIAWSIVAWFFYWCMGRISVMCEKPFSTSAFGDTLASSVNSIEVFGWSLGQGYAVKLLCYAAILAVVLTMPVAVMATLSSGLPWGSFVSTYSSGVGAPGHSMIAAGLALANQFFPWVMVISTPVYYFLVEAILFPSKLFWMMFMKFLPI